MREACELTKEQAASQIHVSPRSWYRYEAGEREISKTHLHLFLLLNAPTLQSRLGKSTAQLLQEAM
jgi:DNA-binding XRE family transcriptional regulator